MFIDETAVYSKFVKYVRDVSSGRRVVTLGNILESLEQVKNHPLVMQRHHKFTFQVNQVQVWVVFEKFFLYRIANIAGKMCKTGCGDESI